MTEFDPTARAGYHFWATEHVRFADLDMLGHVNNKAFATYFETLRVGYFIARGLGNGPVTGMALVRLEIDYRRELHYPATLDLGIRLDRLGASSLTVFCAIFNGATCAATSRAIVVRFDSVARKSRPFTDQERRALLADLPAPPEVA
jgi:acyl-CoA thioester hydrolase